MKKIIYDNNKNIIYDNINKVTLEWMGLAPLNTEYKALLRRYFPHSGSACGAKALRQRR